MAARVLIVALDSAEPSLVQAWAFQGYLPTIERLLKNGSTLAIENFPGFGNGVFWPSINTGVDPSHHGCYWLAQPKPPDFSFAAFHKKDFPLPPFWRALESEGLHIGVMDAIESPVAELEKGIEIVDWITHRRDEPPRTSPPALIDELLARYGDDPLQGNDESAMRQGMDIQELSAISERRIATKTKAAIDLINGDDWDLFYVVYPDPHDIGHLAWHVHESASAQGNATDDPLRRCYQRIDAALAELVNTVVPGGQTIVLMGPGMERVVSANHLLPDILRAFQNKPRSGLTKMLARSLRAFVRSRLLPLGVQKRFGLYMKQKSQKAQNIGGRVCFTVPHNSKSCAVRINVKGRDPFGVVTAGRDYDEVCEQLTSKLFELRDASGEHKVVKEVIKIHDHYNGPELARLPDLMVVWDQDADLSRVSAPKLGTFTGKSMSERTGDHSQRGLLISDQPFELKGTQPVDPAQVTPILIDAAMRNRKSEQV